MFGKKEVISAFDIEGDFVKLAQIRVDDTQKSLHRLAIQKAQRSGKDGLIRAIRKLASDHKVGGTHILVNLPRHKATIKNLKLPSVNRAELESMVGLQAAKQLPFSPDKIISGYRVLGTDKNGYSDVMMVLAHRDVINNILTTFNEAGLDVARIALSSEALNLWYVKRQKTDEKKASICLADIGRSVLEVQIIKEGHLDFTRSVNFSSLADMEEKITEEIKKSLFTYKKIPYSVEITKLVLSGRRSLVEKEAPVLKRELGFQTVYVDAIKTVPRDSDAVLAGSAELDTESFTTVLSLGFFYNRLETNLIPQEIRLKKISHIAKESLVVTLALALSVFVGIGGIVLKHYIDKKRFLASISKNIEEIKPKVEKLTRLKEATLVIKNQMNITGSSIDIIREIYGRIPKQISLTIFDYEDSHACLLRGASKSLSDIFKFITILEESQYFKNVKVKYATKRVIGKKEFTDFEIICELAKVTE